ncbi:hypothetical protein [Streptomyces chartreusis]|uniref:hypothetical protein n=1 Tax=Streptomyces chartreusis TaxID=1969 RepID=UPI00380E9EA7
MRPLRDRLELWAAKARDFVSGGDAVEIYNRCVLAALDDPQTLRLLGMRDGVTREAVLERMRLTSYHRYATVRCPSTILDEAVEKLDEVREKHEQAARDTQWDWRLVCSVIVVTAFAVLLLGGFFAFLATFMITGVVVVTLFWRGSAAWFNLRQSLLAAGLGIAWLVQRFEVGQCAARWGQDLHRQGTGPVVADLIRHLLGDDPDSLFIPDDYDWGLRAPRAPGFIVENGARRQLERKLSHIEDGTIAVCGPRGAGKTTLLEQSVKKAGFGVIVQAPATYTPHDFLLSLSVQLCRQYMRDRRYEPPEITRPSPARILLRRLRAVAKRAARWTAFALPAAALLVLGLSASARALYDQYAASAADFVRTQADSVHDGALQIWQGHGVIASLITATAGIAWWKARHAAWLPRVLGRLWTRGSKPLGLIAAWASAATVLCDEQIRQQVVHFEHGQLAKTVFSTTVLAFLWSLLRLARDSGVEFPLGRWHVSLDGVFRPVAAAAGIALLLYLIDNPQTRTLLADPENPPRLAGIVAGILLAKAGGWSPRPEEPVLVTQCRTHLYRLQTVQQATNGLSAGGAAQILSLGANHATSISTLPPNYPELVGEFRTLLKSIAAEKARQGKTVIIAIDEVDRLGTDAQALAFLSEIKAILGVPDVYYLISVAEDVGATFVRRGLPHRDVTDSSLDDIVHVQPSTVAESRAVLAKRSRSLKEPHAMLAHALSGGILRDLLRYGLQIREIQDKTQSHELTDISRHLVLEELSETFAGFRVLLGKHSFTRDTSDVLASFRTLCSYLREPCPCTEDEMLHMLQQFAFHPHPNRPDAPAVADEEQNSVARQELADDSRQLVDEASAYAYFSLTLLDIFSTEGLERRTRRAAAHGPDGDPERLADARQELGISPYSARPLIDTIRKAWSLPLAPTTIGRTPPSLIDCPRHPRTV